jgi:RimJ/RimL family protein N-acetyltransferase
MFPDAMETARLVLRPVGLADARAIFREYGQDAEVTRFLTWRPHRSVAETEAYVTACSRATRERTYAIVGRAAGDVLGAFALRQEVGHRVEFGYVLARRAWGRGLMTEALAEAVAWALGQPEIWRIGGVCDVENIGSARVMEKAGLLREGVLRRWIVHPNVSDAPRDCFSYARAR